MCTMLLFDREEAHLTLYEVLQSMLDAETKTILQVTGVFTLLKLPPGTAEKDYSICMSGELAVRVEDARWLGDGRMDG